VTPRSLKSGGVEIQGRTNSDRSIVSTDDVVSVVQRKIADLLERTVST